MDIEDIETPAVLVDLTVVESNIHRTQLSFDQLGLGFRPHIKTHKIPWLARQQIQAGAIGIACQKISEAEVFAAEDFDDILLCFNLLSPDKIARARALTEKTQLSTVADNVEVVAALSEGFRGVDEPLRPCVGRVHQHLAAQADRTDLGGRIADVEAGQAARVPFAREHGARKTAPERPRLLDLRDRQHT